MSSARYPTGAFALASLVAMTVAQQLPAEIRITEYMYSGPDGEFFEITNLGNAPIDLTGWSIDDVAGQAGTFAIGEIGLLGPGESAVITDNSPSLFRSAWGLSANAKVVGFLGIANGNNIGRNDAVSLYDQNGVLADQLIYGDQAFPGSLRTQNKSGWAAVPGLGQNDPYAWQYAVAGDAQGSVAAATGELGNPGSFVAVGGRVNGLGMTITEWMYDGTGGEFMEFTNLSDAPIDLTGWSYDDNNFGSGFVGPFDLSAFGVVQPGETVVLTETASETFRTNWGIAPTVKIIGNLGATYGNGLGRNDSLNVYDAEGVLIDTLSYGDEAFPGSIRTQNMSGWTVSGIGLNDPYQWQLSAAGDQQQSVISTGGAIGNPCSFTPPVVLVPSDLNADGHVDAADLAILLGAWGSCTGCPADLDANGTVDAADLAVLLGAWSL